MGPVPDAPDAPDAAAAADDLRFDTTHGYLALRGDGAAVRVERDFVGVSGPEAGSFLQGQLSQDVASLKAGGSAWSFLLQPTGKVDAWLRVSRVDGDAYLLDVDAGFGEAVAQRLNRFKLRTKVTIEAAPAWRCLAVRGRSVEVINAVKAVAPWPGLEGVDLLATDDLEPAALGLAEAGTDAYEAVRIECGVPKMGAELTESTIPAEAGRWVIDASVDFTKGCYTGQELVARIDSRGGNVPRQLRGVVIAVNVLPPIGSAVEVGGEQVGSLTSVGESLLRRAPVGLASVARRVEPPADAVVRWDGGEAPARVEALPLVSS
jgi:tRNA-modifying protein YgfZ